MSEPNYRQVGSNRLAQPIGVRVKSLVKHRLGDRLWKEFSREARRVGNGCFVRAFVPGRVVCSGAIDGAKCPVAGIAGLGLCYIHAGHTWHTEPGLFPIAPVFFHG